MTSKELGYFGEKIAEKYLKNKGYQILDKNYSFRILGPQKGEVDLVVKKEGVICFVEVKTLTSDKIILPEEKVDYIKQRKIIKTAESWLMKNKIPLDSKWQIDVIAIEIDSINKKAKIRHFKNAVF